MVRRNVRYEAASVTFDDDVEWEKTEARCVEIGERSGWGGRLKVGTGGTSPKVHSMRQGRRGGRYNVSGSGSGG